MVKVTLLGHSPNPEQTIAAAAKLCYSASSIEDLQQGLTPEKAADFVDMLSNIGHESPIEHASFTFGIEGVSRSFLAQMTRHRMASFSVQSQRYVDASGMEMVTPPQIAQNPQALEVYQQAMQQAQQAYSKIAELLMEENIQLLCQNGMEEKAAKKDAQKKSIEDARFVLPNACTTKMVATFNARSLMNFFALRCCNRAQWEIREVACQMLALAYQAAPTLFRFAGPGCVSGPCPEGKMCCGQATEVKKSIKELKGVLE